MAGGHRSSASGDPPHDWAADNPASVLSRRAAKRRSLFPVEDMLWRRLSRHHGKLGTRVCASSRHASIAGANDHLELMRVSSELGQHLNAGGVRQPTAQRFSIWRWKELLIPRR